MIKLLAFVALAACAGPRPAALAPAPDGSGPRVVFDLDALPLPEIPFPNDLATRTESSSPTGRRINISTHAPTALERGLRAQANTVSGFSTYGAMSVRFDARVDLANIVGRHHNNRDFADDVVLLVNLQPGSPRFGELVPLDLGQGNFPVTVPRTDAFWENDPRRSVANLLFDTTDEDANRNGLLDRGEDTDDDGFLDVPNVFPVGGDPIRDVLTFYERVTNTLIFRPVVPLEQEALHGVVLTRALRGEDGQPVRSPFAGINHARQTEQLRDLPEALRRNGFALADVAFAWAFTTQSTTRDLEALRRGLYGHGPFARLAREFPPDLTLLPVVDTSDEPHLISGEKLKEAAPLILNFFFGGDTPGARALLASYDNVDYFVVGTVRGPNLLADKDGIASPGYPADDDEVWDLDRLTGRAHYAAHDIPYLCALPRKDRGRGAPFPVAMYQHGYGSSRLEMLGFAGNVARYGIATCVTDAYGHGLVVPPDLEEIVDAAFAGYGLRGLKRALVPGRARDLDNDGVPDSGGDFFTADLFHTRDMVRQSVLDLMVLVRALRACDGARTTPQALHGGGAPSRACDFDGDGVPDLGGPAQDFFTWGQSLGGILSSTLAGIEPAIAAAAPSSGGGGLSDIALRSTQGGVPEAAILRTLGPIVVGEPSAGQSGTVDLAMIVASVNNRAKRVFARSAAIAPGDRLVLENRVNGKTYETFAGDGGRFRAQVAADALDATTKRARLGLPTPRPAQTAAPRVPDTRAVGDALALHHYDGRTGALRKTFATFEVDVEFEGAAYAAGSPLVALAMGWGLQRNTPELRRFLGLAQLTLDPGDPINYAPHYFLAPLRTTDYDSAEPGANVCVIVTAGDTAVPASTGIALARAAGIVDPLTVDPRYGKTPNDVLIDSFVVEGLSWLRRFDNRRVVMDPENFARGRDGNDVPRLEPPLRLTRSSGRGVSALRVPLGNPAGQHSFAIPEPDRAFDLNTFLVHMVARYFQSRGRELRDDACMATASCDWIPPSAGARP